MGYKIIITDESGQSLTEYSLIISIVAIAAIATVLLFGQALSSYYENIKKAVVEAL